MATSGMEVRWLRERVSMFIFFMHCIDSGTAPYRPECTAESKEGSCVNAREPIMAQPSSEVLTSPDQPNHCE